MSSDSARVTPAHSPSPQEPASDSTRPAQTADAQGGALSAVRNGGYCVMDARLDYRNAPLTSSARADTIFSYINSLSTRQLTIYFGRDTRNTAGLGSLLSRLEEGQCRVLAYRETLGGD